MTSMNINLLEANYFGYALLVITNFNTSIHYEVKFSIFPAMRYPGNIE